MNGRMGHDALYNNIHSLILMNEWEGGGGGGTMSHPFIYTEQPKVNKLIVK